MNHADLVAAIKREYPPPYEVIETWYGCEVRKNGRLIICYELDAVADVVTVD